MTIKEKIELYISENYDKLLSAANIITNDETAGDLLNMVLVQILKRKSYSELVKNCNNYFNYINRAMVLCYISSTTEYAIYFKRDYAFNLSKEEDIVEPYSTLYDDIINYVIKTNFYEEEEKKKLLKAKTLKQKAKIRNNYKLKNMVDKKLFLDYFNNEDKRRTSYRIIGKKWDISHQTVMSSVKKILNNIKKNSIY